MRNAAAALLLLAGCSGLSEPDDPDPVEHVERYYEPLHAEIPRSGDLQFMAVCPLEHKTVGAWTESESEAYSAASGHESRYPVCRAYVVWRERPETTFPPVKD